MCVKVSPFRSSTAPSHALLSHAPLPLARGAPVLPLAEAHLLLQHPHAQVCSFIQWAQSQCLLVVSLREGQVAQLVEAI